MTQKSFGQLFRELRTGQEIPLRRFCIENNFDAGYISKMERGLMPPPESHDLLQQYAKALNIESGSAQWSDFFTLARVEKGKIPDALKESATKIFPILVRTFENKTLDADKFKELLEELKQV